MSYFGRLASRAGGTAPVGLAPANRLASPFARIDQRLNLFAEWSTPLGHGTLRAGGVERNAASSADREGGAPSISRESAGPEPEAPANRSAEVRRLEPAPPPRPAVPPAVLETRPLSRATPVELESDRHAPSRRSSPSQEHVSAEADALASRTVEPRQPPARPTDPVRASEALGPAARVERQAALNTTEVAPVFESLAPAASSAAPARSSAHEGKGDAGATSTAEALQQALDRVNAWMSRPRQERTPERSQAEHPSAPQERAAAPRLLAEAARRDHEAGAALRLFEPRSAPSRAPEPAAPPTLTIGSIEVRVVPPAQPPVVVHAPRARAAAAPTSGGGRLSSHLTFGLRQR